MTKLTSYLINLFIIPEKYASRILEGFEPKTVANEILENRILQIIEIIEKIIKRLQIRDSVT